MPHQEQCLCLLQRMPSEGRVLRPSPPHQHEPAEQLSRRESSDQHSLRLWPDVRRPITCHVLETPSAIGPQLAGRLAGASNQVCSTYQVYRVRVETSPKLLEPAVSCVSRALAPSQSIGDTATQLVMLWLQRRTSGSFCVVQHGRRSNPARPAKAWLPMMDPCFHMMRCLAPIDQRSGPAQSFERPQVTQ